MVVKEPCIKMKRTTYNKDEKDATIQSAKEAKTTVASTDNQSEHQRMKDKSPQLEEKLEIVTNKETRT